LRQTIDTCRLQAKNGRRLYHGVTTLGEMWCHKQDFQLRRSALIDEIHLTVRQCSPHEPRNSVDDTSDLVVHRDLSKSPLPR
jgi:hypothetical protein